MSELLLSFYGDDFTGSTDALEQLTLAGIRTVLFIEPPSRRQLARFGKLQAIGVAGMTRSLKPAAMERELRPALKKLKTLGARHVHYKVCSTFDSSPRMGSIGRVIEIGAELFRSPFIPLLIGAPALGRYCVFGNLFARFGIGSAGEIHRLDRHPSISRHPITPMREADLRLHLAKQTNKRIALFDLLKLQLPRQEAHAALRKLAGGEERADVVLFDVFSPDELPLIGELMDAQAMQRKPLFSVGSSGVEMALGAFWQAKPKSEVLKKNSMRMAQSTSGPLLVGSGSCSPVTSQQIDWALANGFAEVALGVGTLVTNKNTGDAISRAVIVAANQLRSGKSVIIHTLARKSHSGIKSKLKSDSAKRIGTALGRVLQQTMEQIPVKRLCVAGGDTSSFAARALGIEALEMIARITPGAPLCRAHASGSPVNGCEVVFKGGQVGPKNYFGIVKDGGNKMGDCFERGSLHVLRLKL